MAHGNRELSIVQITLSLCGKRLLWSFKSVNSFTSFAYEYRLGRKEMCRLYRLTQKEEFVSYPHACVLIYLQFINSLWYIWGFWRQKHVSQAGISKCIPQNTGGCLRYLLLVAQSWYILFLKNYAHSCCIAVCYCVRRVFLALYDFTHIPHEYFIGTGDTVWCASEVTLMKMSDYISHKLTASWSWWSHQMAKNFRVTGHLRGEFTGHRWIPITKGSGVELWCFLWTVPE